MGRSAVALHARAQQRETAEDRIERVERAGAATISRSAPSARSAVSSSATTRAAPLEKRIGNRRPPTTRPSASAPSRTRALLGSSRSCATAPIVVGLNPLRHQSPRVAPIFSTARRGRRRSRAASPCTGDVRQARRAGREEAEDRDPSCAFASVQRLAPDSSRPRRVAVSSTASRVAFTSTPSPTTRRSRLPAFFGAVAGLDDQQWISSTGSRAGYSAWPS